MQTIFSLSGKVVLVTGGYGYLGHSICQGLAQSGAEVVVLGRHREKFEQSFTKENKSIYFISCDVSSTHSVQMAYQQAQQTFGKIDVLINNAFYLKGGKADQLNDEDWAYSMDGTINNYYRCIREVLPYFRAHKSGRIINVSSMYGMVAPDFTIYENHPQYVNPPHYGVGKAGVIQLTKYFASFLGKENILVNSVSPGPFPSKQVQENQSFIEVLARKTTLGRIGLPEELQGVFIFLSASASSYINGQNIAVDGGWTIT